MLCKRWIIIIKKFAHVMTSKEISDNLNYYLWKAINSKILLQNYICLKLITLIYSGIP